MKLYDSFINQYLELVPNQVRTYSYKKSSLVQGDRNSIILSKDAAFELGGSQTKCVSTLAVTSTMSFNDEIVLVGKDLQEIKADCPFGKLVFLEIEDIDEQEAFDKIKELELVRYKYCPQGFMTRASALNLREQIRISKKAKKSGVTFADFGSALIEQYKSFDIVKSVKIIFFTEFTDFDEMFLIADRIKSTTAALNHIFDNILFDCSTCNLKEICDEVDGMKELHFKNSNK